LRERAEWPYVRLGDYVDLLSGFPFESKRFTENENDIHLVKGANVHQGFIDWKGAKRWPASEFERYKKFELLPGDVVIAMDRPWIEAGLKFAWIRLNDPRSLLVQRVARLRGINGLVTNFLRYIFASPAFTDYIKPIVTGVNVPHISGDQIRGFMFHLPPITIQQRIVAVLSVCDDLIENNLRRIKILEDMAQSIYREWFIHFRFPGHEKVKMADSPLGKIPRGWDLRRLDSFGPVVLGKTPSKAKPEYFGSEMPFIKLPDMHGNVFCIQTLEKLSALGVASQEGKTIPADSLCVSCIGTAGEVCITSESSQTNQQINSIVPENRGHREFLYCALLGLRDTINQYGATGATMVNLNKEKFAALTVLCPSDDVIMTYHDAVVPFFDSIKCLLCENIRLRQIRDLLLPKLISGETDVSKLDINEGN
jgi:type I restriction enzyme S subunit